MKKYIIPLAAVVITFSSTGARAIDPAAMTADDIQLVTHTCRDAQRSLQRLQYVDPVTRVSRGTATAGLVKLMSALNSRAALNTFNIPALVTATNNVQTLRQQFVDEYTQYDVSMRDLIAMDCVNAPTDFYQRLSDVRHKRQQLAAQVRLIEQQLDMFWQHIPDIINLVRE